MTRMNIPYGRQSIDGDDVKAVLEALTSDFITQGPRIAEFEEALAAYCGARHAVAFNSGTAALHAVYFALGLKAGDEFVTSPMTFAATANAGLYLGARPVFADVETETGNLDPSALEAAITERTRLIVPVHYAGHPVDLDAISRIAARGSIPVVEDACHALGASYRGRPIGSCDRSAAAVFSFHPVKSITTGEGGAATTNDRALYEKMRLFRTHGITREGLSNEAEGAWYYEMRNLGFNYRITDIQAALGTSQLKKLDSFIAGRREIAAFYGKSFAGNRFFDAPGEREYARSAYHLYPIRIKGDKGGAGAARARAFKGLRDRGLGVNVHYIPVYLHPYYLSLGYGPGLCPAAEEFYSREISVPIFPSMTREEMDYSAKAIIEATAGS